MSIIEFKSVAPDDPAAIIELRKNVQSVAEMSAEATQRAADELVKIQNAQEETRVQLSDVVADLRKTLSEHPSKKTDDADEGAVRRMVEDVRLPSNEKELSEMRGISQGHFGLIAQSTRDLRDRGADEAMANELQELQRLNDVILIENARRMLSDPGYAMRGGMRSLRWWKRYEQLATKFARALNETNANDGLNWVPSILSGNLKRLVQVEQRLANFFSRVNMTSKTLDSVVEGADFFASYIAEGTSDTTSDGAITPTQFTTPKATFTARKLAGAVVTTREIEADAVVDMVSEVLLKIAKSIRRALESGIVNGQRTTIDTTLTIAASDHRKAFNGIRSAYVTQGSTAADFSAGVTAEGILALTAAMCPEGKAYGLDPADRIFLTSPAGYIKLLSLKGSANNAVVLTQDVAGSANTFQRGQLGEMFGSALVVSEFVSQQMSVAGLVTSPAGSKTAIYCVSTSSFAIGERLGITLDASPHVLFLNDKMVYRGVARYDFQPYYTPSASDPIVAAGFGLAAA